MHIDSIQLWRVPLETLSMTASSGPLESVLVSLRSGSHTGWGEITLPNRPFDCDEWPAAVFLCLRDFLAPAILGRSIDSPRALQAVCAAARGNHRAKAALDIAWWNLSAAMRGQPLFETLGGTRRVTPLACTLGVTDSEESLFHAIRAAYDTGYELVTLKFRPGWALEMLRAVRQAFPAEPLAIDCDGLCSLAEQDMFYRLQDFQLAFIEQPLPDDDLVGHAMLQESLQTPILLDQSVTSLSRAEQAIDLGSCRQMRINVARVGGLTPALEIRAACEAASIPCALGGSPQGALADCAAAALAGLPYFSRPAEILLHCCQQPWFAAADKAWLAQTSAGRVGFAPPADSDASGPAIDVDRLLAAAVDHVTIG